MKRPLSFLLDEIRRRDADRAAAASRDLADAALKVSRYSLAVAIIAVFISVGLGVAQLVIALKT
jgi:hypothetical protein